MSFLDTTSYDLSLLLLVLPLSACEIKATLITTTQYCRSPDPVVLEIDFDFESLGYTLSIQSVCSVGYLEPIYPLERASVDIGTPSTLWIFRFCGYSLKT
ncbi:hypothetical protein SK128_004975 [Halocaridina rubra]|uniref:Uncharacterized protein n=1 Tax=Halocaridina rubra TaxID=373956 RepID=A0AAN8X8H7_HALRR